MNSAALAAFQIKSNCDCDAWLIEVGLGGRLDATNIIESSVSLLTSIAMDHEEWLGDSIDKIADSPSFYSENEQTLDLW